MTLEGRFFRLAPKAGEGAARACRAQSAMSVAERLRRGLAASGSRRRAGAALSLALILGASGALEAQELPAPGNMREGAPGNNPLVRITVEWDAVDGAVAYQGRRASPDPSNWRGPLSSVGATALRFHSCLLYTADAADE